MSGYLERIAALATGQGPRLRPRPRYRYGDAPAWAPAHMPDTPALPTHETSREDAVPGAREQHITQLGGPRRGQSTHEQQRSHTLDASRTQAQHALTSDAFTEEAAPRLLPLRTLLHANGDTGRATPFTADRAEMDGTHRTQAPSHRAWPSDETPLAGFERAHPDSALREPRGREAARRDAHSNEPPTVTVHIGHIDVRAVAAPAAAPAPGASTRERAEGPRRPSLDAYLRTRDRERQ